MTFFFANGRLREIVIPNSIGNRNALVGFVGCIKIPACAGMTDVLMDFANGSIIEGSFEMESES